MRRWTIDLVALASTAIAVGSTVIPIALGTSPQASPWFIPLTLLAVPLVVGIGLHTLNTTQRAIDLAFIGLVAAIGTGLRLVTGGLVPVELVFSVLIAAGAARGRQFGFIAGASTIALSAILSAGIGPWLPFQLVGAAMTGYFAGVICSQFPRRFLMAAVGVVVGFGYGALLDLWSWSLTVGEESSLSADPHLSLGINLQRFMTFHVSTSLGWDALRAAVTAVTLLLVGTQLVSALAAPAESK